MSWIARILEERHGAIAVAVVEGEIDSSNVDDIGDRARAMLTNQSESLVLDLEKVRYIDSAGINLLFSLGTELDERQQRLLVVVAPASGIARMLAITGLDAAVACYPTRAEALAAAADG